MNGLNTAATYQAHVQSGQLKPDAGQAAVIQQLDKLHTDLLMTPRSTWQRFFHKKSTPPMGVYIYGAVGRGKSMVMDLFFDSVPATIPKRRVHFHAFMQELHQSLHRWRQNQTQGMDSALLQFAQHVARQTKLLCFDEFHVVDVADAMLLGRLFQALWSLQVVIVATSNWAPDDLYKDGLQRDRFLPFIAALKSHLHVCYLASKTDYRLARLRGHRVYYAPLGSYQRAEMENLFHDLLQDTELQPLEIPLSGRRWFIRRAAKGIVWLDFAEACGEARGASDYLALAQQTQVVFLDNIPLFNEDMRNEVKRLMTLVDILYENKVRLVIGAEAEPQNLYPKGFHGFEFERTISRLMEMQSLTYLNGVIGG
jgi:cell division protein ZapE